ncbi:hypothetical protein ACI2K4_28550 [Micromonospora sp. NPDC050397]|uniref:hypothetical protein n=1 Tax=Micromonospora sp. NPDC050397 TaxID=3364279 RepID=UPI00384B09DE
MQAIRHQLLVLAGLVVLAFVVGVTSALWVGFALAVCVGLNRSAALFHDTRHAMAVITTLTVLSIVAGAAGAVLLFVLQGWPAGVGYLVLQLGYFAAAESPLDRSRRRAQALRDGLVDLVRARAARTISEDQLTARAGRLLRTRLRGPDFHGDTARTTLTGGDGLSTEEHRQLLRVLDHYLGVTRRDGVTSRLHAVVRQRRGSV